MNPGRGARATAASRPAPARAGTPTRGDAPLGLYVHFPFCAARCHYCAFYFVVGQAEKRAAYVDAVVAEIERAPGDARFCGRPVSSVYFGGGTPSLLPADAVARIVAAARNAFDVAADAEISLESNPDGLTTETLAALRSVGVNRLTIGWQSLRDGNLKVLTRTHTAAENVAALERARAAGFDNVGVDLIFGVPGQSVDDWRAELDEAGAYGVDHVSAYELTLEEGTRLAERAEAGRFRLADEDDRLAMFEARDEVLGRHGIARYEISNFAKPGRECRHNLAGWRGADLLGVGASAASHVARERWTNVADLDAYVARVGAGEPVAEDAERLDDATWAAEDLYLGLRTADGVEAAARLARVDEAGRHRLMAVLQDARDQGLLEPGPAVPGRGDRVRLTRKGLRLADTVFDALLG
jgi:oxygen-independent coproporphyrinogen-3 oxidase